MGKSEDLQDLINNLRAEDHEIKEVVLTTHEGLVLMSSDKTKSKDEVISAISPYLLAACQRAISNLEKGDITNVVITGTKGAVILKEMPGKAILTVTTTLGINLAKTLPRLRSLMQDIEDKELLEV